VLSRRAERRVGAALDVTELDVVDDGDQDRRVPVPSEV
jgi:hypothetical protein